MSNRYINVLKKKERKFKEAYFFGVSSNEFSYLKFVTSCFKKQDDKILSKEKEIIDLIPFVKEVFKKYVKVIDYGWKNNKLHVFILLERGYSFSYPFFRIAEYMKIYKLKTYQDFLKCISFNHDENTIRIKKLIKKSDLK